MSAVAVGRRERKKLAARAAILDASSTLFIECGFDGTRIETIAQRADVGVGTVYNHFATKADILVAILFDDVGEVVARTREVVERGEPSAGAVLRDAIEELFTIMERRPRDLWRDLIAEAIGDRGALGIAYLNSERILRGVVHRGLERLRETGSASRRIEIGDATDIVFAMAKTAVYAFVFEPDTESAQLLAILERQIDAVFG